MDYNVDLVAFEGPMDLLLHLINEAKINIYDIPIKLITEQFIDYINKMHSLNLEITSEFLIMASTLLEIKSRMLLPKKDTHTSEEEEDPRDELVARLIEYKRYKNVVEELKEMKVNQSKVYTKPRDEYFEEEPEIELEKLNIENLMISIKNILKNRDIEDQLTTLNEIKRDRYSVEDFIGNLKDKLNFEEEILFSSLISSRTNIEEIVTYFLAVLELVKEKYLTVIQTCDFSDLILNRREV